MDQLPGDLIYLLGMYLDYDSLSNYCIGNKVLARICLLPEFWRDRAVQDLGVDPETWKEVESETGNSRQAYVRLAAEHGVPFWGAERYGNIDKLTLEAAKTDNLPLVKHFYQISENPDIFYVLASRNKREYILALSPGDTEKNIEIIKGALAGGHLELAQEYIDSTEGYDLIKNSVISGKLNVVVFTINLVKDMLKDDAEGFITELDDGLTEAVKHKFNDIIELLINEGAADLTNAVFEAAKIGDKQLIQKLTSRERNLDGYLAPGLNGAAYGGHKSLVDYFINLGANVQDNPMGWAAAGGHIDMIKYLESKGANDYMRAINTAIREGSGETIKYLFSHLSDDDSYKVTIRNLYQVLARDDPQIFMTLMKWINWDTELTDALLRRGSGKILRVVLKIINPPITSDMIPLAKRHFNILTQLIDYQITKVKKLREGLYAEMITRIYQI